ncbi:MAG: hypothetical protein IJ007_00860 [Oscillospiraceae bacterium]|nr:hypothetical protein [Oscillospiraceae bacterium]
MNMLTDSLCDHIVVEGVPYPIHTDFRTWIKFTLLLERNEDAIKTITEALILCFPGKSVLPSSLEETMRALIDFCVGESKESKGKPGEHKRIYSFEYDHEMIYSAFMHDYGINLTTAHLHWHEFKALFSGLSKDTQFCEVMGYRSVNLSEIKDKTQRKFYRDMKQKFKLPDMRTQEQKEADMINVFEAAF